MILAYIGLGGALGAMARYGVGVLTHQWVTGSVPLATMIVNITGSFLMGCLIALTAYVWFPSQEVKAFLMIGVLGGFTTFSSFSMDVLLMLEKHDYGSAILYGTGSVVLSLVGIFAGLYLIRGIVS